MDRSIFKVIVLAVFGSAIIYGLLFWGKDKFSGKNDTEVEDCARQKYPQNNENIIKCPTSFPNPTIKNCGYQRWDHHSASYPSHNFSAQPLPYYQPPNNLYINSGCANQLEHKQLARKNCKCQPDLHINNKYHLDSQATLPIITPNSCCKDSHSNVRKTDCESHINKPKKNSAKKGKPKACNRCQETVYLIK